MKQPINKSYRILYKRIQKLTPQRLIDEGFISEKQADNYYGPNRNKSLKRFEYIKITTDEGVHGVHHILYFGHFLPKRWISKNWFEITGAAEQVDIRQIKGKKMYDRERLARYCISQYVAGQTAFLRYSISQNWVFKGFMQTWNYLKPKHTRKRNEPILINGYPYWNELDLKGMVRDFHRIIDERIAKRPPVQTWLWAYDLEQDN